MKAVPVCVYTHCNVGFCLKVPSSAGRGGISVWKGNEQIMLNVTVAVQ